MILDRVVYIRENFFQYLFLCLIILYIITIISYIILCKKLKFSSPLKINKKLLIGLERFVFELFIFEIIFIPITGWFVFAYRSYPSNQLDYFYDLFLLIPLTFPLNTFKYLQNNYYNLRKRIKFKGHIIAHRGNQYIAKLDTDNRAMLATIMAFYSSIAIIEGYILALIPLKYCSSMVFFSIVAICSVLQLLIWYYNTIEQKRKITFYILSIINELLTLISITSLCALTYKSFPRENFGLSILFIKGLLIIIYIGKNFFFNKKISNDKLKLFDFIFTSLNNSNTKVALINICASLLFYIISLFN